MEATNIAPNYENIFDPTLLLNLGFKPIGDRKNGRFRFIADRHNQTFDISLTFYEPNKFWNYNFAATMVCDVATENGYNIFMGLVFENIEELIEVIKKSPLYEYLVTPKVPIGFIYHYS